MNPTDRSHSNPEAGLCPSCRHCQIIRSSKGSTFYMCRRAATDPRFLKYPPLPMHECEGFEAGGGNQREDEK